MPIVPNAMPDPGPGAVPDAVIERAIEAPDDGDDDGAPAGWGSEQPLVVMLLRTPDRDPLYSIVLRRGTLETRR